MRNVFFLIIGVICPRLITKSILNEPLLSNPVGGIPQHGRTCPKSHEIHQSILEIVCFP